MLFRSKPVSPQRSPLLALALFMGLAAGAVVAYLYTLLKPVFHSARQLAELTGVAVLGVVSASRLAGTSNRSQYWRYTLACSTLVAGLVVVVLVGRAYAPLSLASVLH